MDTCVDPLVLQLEDDDPTVRLSTLQKLRKVAAVESSHFPVRNPRRFLQCVRRRTLDEHPDVSKEALRLIVDVMAVLGDDVEQILSSILPHLIPHLARSRKTDELEPLHVDDEVYRVFRKFVAVSNDLKSVAELLMNVGMAHALSSVREASLVVVSRLLDERYAKRRLTSSISTHPSRSGTPRAMSTSRMDKALFVAILQATIPILEDTDMNVVVAAEEAIAKLELYWGDAFHTEAAQFLSCEDNQTLQQHQGHIEEFLAASMPRRIESSSRPSTGRSTKSLNGSPSNVDDLGADSRRSFGENDDGDDEQGDRVHFGFVPAAIMSALATSSSTSNADWKKRAAAVEQLFAVTKEVDSTTLGERLSDLGPLFAALARLMLDVDAHMVKRALQITQTLFAKLSEFRANSGNDREHEGHLMLKILVPVVETAANFVEDEVINTIAYGLLHHLFLSGCHSVSRFQQALSSVLQSRRLQVREEAIKVWMVLLLTGHCEGLSMDDIADEGTMLTLGRLLGDASVRIRETAREAAAVIEAVTQGDVYTLLEAAIDDQFIAERIDWATLRRRLRQKHIPELLPTGTLSFVPASASSSRTSVSGKSYAVVDQSLPGTSELQMLRMSQVLRTSSTGDVRASKTNSMDASVRSSLSSTNCGGSVSSAGSLSDRPRYELNGTSTTPRNDKAEIGGSRDSEEMADMLASLKRKSNHLRKSTSTKRIEESQNPERPEMVQPRSSIDRPSPARSKTSPDNSARGKVAATESDQVSPRASPPTVRRSVSISPKEQPIEDRPVRQRTPVSPTPDQLSPQKLQDIQTRTVNREDRPIRSRVITQEEEEQQWRQANGEAEVPKAGADRPIRPMAAAYKDADNEYPTPDDDNDQTIPPRKRPAPAMSLATRKRLEAKQRQDELEQLKQQPAPVDKPIEDVIQEEETGSGARPTSGRPVSLATRKRLEAKTKPAPATSAPVEDAGRARPSALGGQEPKYLESHELTPVANAKQDAAKLVTRLGNDEWTAAFEALSLTRRLAKHHPELLAPQLSSVVAAVLRQVPNLRSSVSKNALLALESLCAAFGRQIDSEVDALVALLLKRCADTNQFVCASAASSLASVLLHCSTGRVVAAMAVHMSSRAVPIRREVARGMHVLVTSQGANLHTSRDLPAMLALVGKCLEDSNNEVRDAARQSMLYLLDQQRMDPAKLKKMLPAGAQAKLDQLLKSRCM